VRALLALVLAVATGACGSPSGPSFTIDTSLSPAQKSLDLSAVQGDEFAFDVILE
jgi:hypothetical protein